MFRSLKRNDFKILLLGAENSGKTTFSTKMRFMFGHQLSHEDIEKYKKLILNQLINCMHTLILDLALLGLDFDSEGKFHFQSKLEYIQAFSDIFQKTISQHWWLF